MNLKINSQHSSVVGGEFEGFFFFLHLQGLLFKKEVMCPICRRMRILRQKQFLKAEKKRKKKEARQNERKRKREEAEKLKQDQIEAFLLTVKVKFTLTLNLSPVDISQAPQIDKQIEVAKKGNVESIKM
ncbi:hypothetical protein P8452_68266 [Trifolium repens]|nr:hypothetical protein P8452_68266 [Trifolium repens]